MPWKPETKKRNLKTQRWRDLREEVIRTEDRCGICFKSVNKDLNGRRDPMGPHVGHIKPVHLRPDLEFDRNNVELQHRKCNLKYGV